MSANPPDPNEHWQVINDFTPGIHQHLSSNYPPGTASPVNTYRCYAREGGALSPLQCRLDATIAHDPPIDPDLNQASEFRIVGLHTVSPLFWPTEPTYGVDQNNTEVFLAYEYWTDLGWQVGVDRYRRHYRVNPAWENIWLSDAGGSPYNPAIRPRHTVFGTTRSNYLQAANARRNIKGAGTVLVEHGGAAVSSGPTCVAWVCSGHARFFPDDTNPSIVSTVALPGDKHDPGQTATDGTVIYPGNPGGWISPDSLVMHQGRAVIMPLTLAAFGDGAILTHNEAMYWTAYNNLRAMDAFAEAADTTVSPDWFGITVGPESPVGYGVMASLTANELLLIKCSGGGYIIQGDVNGVGQNSPTARTLPYVRSTGLSMNNGCYGPTGYVYPVDGGGVWLWQGGDFTTHLTKHLEPEFWRPPAQDLAGTPNLWGHQWSQCDSANNWVLFPNNWMWDTDLNGWWRVDDPDDYIIHRWSHDWRSHHVYGAPSGFRDQTDPALYEYDLTKYAPSYSWQSQPLSQSISDTVQIGDVVVVATGRGRIVVTVSTLQDPEGVRQTFFSTSDRIPDTQRQTFGVRGSHVQIRLEAFADNPDGAAPTIHEVRYQAVNATPIGR